MSTTDVSKVRVTIRGFHKVAEVKIPSDDPLCASWLRLYRWALRSGYGPATNSLATFMFTRTPHVYAVEEWARRNEIQIHHEEYPR